MKAGCQREAEKPDSYTPETKFAHVTTIGNVGESVKKDLPVSFLQIKISKYRVVIRPIICFRNGNT